MIIRLGLVLAVSIFSALANAAEEDFLNGEWKVADAFGKTATVHIKNGEFHHSRVGSGKVRHFAGNKMFDFHFYNEGIGGCRMIFDKQADGNFSVSIMNRMDLGTVCDFKLMKKLAPSASENSFISGERDSEISR